VENVGPGGTGRPAAPAGITETNRIELVQVDMQNRAFVHSGSQVWDPCLNDEKGQERRRAKTALFKKGYAVA
jgi:hypothetical protein